MLNSSGRYIIKPHFFKPETKIKINENKIHYTDLLTYTSLKSYLNSTNYRCDPAFQTIADRAGVSKDFVSSSIIRLEEAGYIRVSRAGKTRIKNRYSFQRFDNFDRIPYGFFDCADLNLYGKSMLLALREMSDTVAPRDIFGSIKELAQILEVSYRTLDCQLRTLISKGYIKQKAKNQFQLDRVNWLINDNKRPKVSEIDNSFVIG
jgi:DNA-binding MarR family transcriptional regulator